MEMLEDFRQRFFSGTSGTIYGDQTDLCNPTELRRLESLVYSYKVLATAPGVLAIEKPAGTETHEAIQILSQELQRTVTFVSRLDQTTSGIVPVVLGDDTSVAANWLRAQWAARLVDKEYICLCAGEFDVDGGEVTGNLRLSAENSMLMEVSPDGRPARTWREEKTRHGWRSDELRGLIWPVSNDPRLKLETMYPPTRFSAIDFLNSRRISTRFTIWQVDAESCLGLGPVWPQDHLWGLG